MIETTVDEVADQLAEIVKEFGEDYRVQGDGSGCRYFNRNEKGERQPVCIVGTWLHRYHPSVFEAIAPRHNSQGFSYASGHRDGFMQVLEFPARVVESLRSAQMVQDEGSTWGEALETFRENAGLPKIA